MKKIALVILILLLIGILYIAIQYGNALTSFFSLEQKELAPNLMAFIGNGGNSLVLFSRESSQVLIVDSKMFKGAKILRHYVDELVDDANIILVNTHFHADHAGGNKLFPDAELIASRYSQDQWENRDGEKYADLIVEFGETYTFTVGADSVKVCTLHGHTGGDLIVYIPTRSVLHTGDLVFNHWHPALLPRDGFDLNGWIASLDTMITEYKADTVIPGHGNIGGAELLREMKSYFVDFRQASSDAEIRALKHRYNDYLSLPGMGFHRNRTLIAEVDTP